MARELRPETDWIILPNASTRNKARSVVYFLRSKNRLKEEPNGSVEVVEMTNGAA